MAVVITALAAPIDAWAGEASPPAPVALEGVMRIDGRLLLRLHDRATGTRDWVPANAMFAGWIVLGYDDKTERAAIAREGRARVISFSSSTRRTPAEIASEATLTTALASAVESILARRERLRAEAGAGDAGARRRMADNPAGGGARNIEREVRALTLVLERGSRAGEEFAVLRAALGSGAGQGDSPEKYQQR